MRPLLTQFKRKTWFLAVDARRYEILLWIGLRLWIWESGHSFLPCFKISTEALMTRDESIARKSSLCFIGLKPATTKVSLDAVALLNMLNSLSLSLFSFDSCHKVLLFSELTYSIVPFSLRLKRPPVLVRAKSTTASDLTFPL